MPDGQSLVEVVADCLADGRVVRETLLVDVVPSGGFRLARSPLVAQGLAVGDEFVVEPVDKTFRVLRRARNIGVQLFMRPRLAREVFGLLAARVRAMGGDFDAHSDSIAGFWIPVDVGFPEVEGLFGDFVSAHPESDWMFVNVYDQSGKPLNWW